MELTVLDQGTIDHHNEAAGELVLRGWSWRRCICQGGRQGVGGGAMNDHRMAGWGTVMSNLEACLLYTLFLQRRGDYRSAQGSKTVMSDNECAGLALPQQVLACLNMNP